VQGNCARKSNRSFREMDMHWKHPWTSIVRGPTSYGKTIFVKTFPIFIVHVWHAFRESSVLLSPIIIRRLCKREGGKRGSDAGLRRSAKEEKEENNRILRGIITSGRLFNRSAFPEIGNNWRTYKAEYRRIPKALIVSCTWNFSISIRRGDESYS